MKHIINLWMENITKLLVEQGHNVTQYLQAYINNRSHPINNEIQCEPYQGYNKHLLATGNYILIVGMSLATAIVLTTCLVKKCYFEKRLPLCFASAEEELRYWANMLNLSKGLEDYYKKEISKETLQQELALNNPYHDFFEIPLVKDLEKQFPPEKIYAMRVQIITKLVVAYCEVYKTFSLEIYKRHMKQYMISFDAIKANFNEKDWERLEKVFGIKARDIPNLEEPNPTINYDGRILEIAPAVSVMKEVANI